MEETTLIIKAPNQKYEDLKIKCQLTWTILDLKIYLCKEYPSKPIISDQRLIYSGHLLKDEQCLGDIIQSENESNTYTFHLVCPQRHVASSSEQTKAAPGTSSASASQAALAPENMNPLVNEQPFPSFAQADALPARNPLLHHLGSNNSAVMQESYNAMLNQYYQYMSYYYLSAPPATDFASYYAFANAYMTSTANATPSVASTINPTPANNNNNNVNGQVNENPAPNVAVHNNNANNVNNNNNQADNEEVNRDWTEMLYSFSKAMVMLSIMYFYSSFGRLLLLIAIAFVLYLYKNARLNGAMNNILNNNNNNEVQNAREQQQQPPAAVVDPANNNEDNRENNHDSDSSADADRANLLNGPAPENSRYTGLRLAWVIVSSLFTSLIPDPTPIN